MHTHPNRFVAALLLFAGCLLVGCGSGGPKDWTDHTQGLPFVVGYDKGLTAAAAENKPAMMFVTTTWCGYCKQLAEENFNDVEVKELLKNFVCVIVDGDVEKSAAGKLGAEGYPHIVFLSSHGDKLEESSGYVPVAVFKPIVERALEKSGKS
jgi:thioredoxin-related protein